MALAEIANLLPEGGLLIATGFSIRLPPPRTAETGWAGKGVARLASRGSPCSAGGLEADGKAQCRRHLRMLLDASSASCCRR